MATLRLGVTDRGAKPRSPAAYFGPYHESSNMQNKFRGEKNDKWRGFKELPGAAVFNLQTRLRDFGFMPHGEINGIFNYRTQSAARLFQEYVRSVEKDASLGVPDAAVGPKTLRHLDRWAGQGLRADWINVSSENPTTAYKNWMLLLHNLKAHYQQKPSPIT